MPAKASKKKKKAPQKARLTARNADKHVLYERSVQEPECDVHFLNRVFKKTRGRKPMRLREDFCGTAWLSAEWVRSDKGRSAVGLDLDTATLEWGRKHHLAPLGEAAERVTLLKRNVLDGVPEKAEIITAFNFSYWTFQDRALMLRYFKKVRAGLERDGAFVIDIHGGPDAQTEVLEKRPKKGFTYLWEQKPMDAVSGRSIRHIHFRFPDGSKIKKAFTYDWRIWNLTELRDILADAGFARSEVYWEGADEDGEGNGIFRKVKQVENEECWIAYVVAWANP